MSESLKRKLAFFRDCLEAETRSQIVWDFPTRKSENVYKLKTGEKGLEIGQSDAKEIGVSSDYHEKVDRVLEFYTREKRLLLSAFFIVGKHPVPSFGGAARVRRIKCPLFLFPCQLAASGIGDAFSGKALITVDSTGGVVNPAVLQIFEAYAIDPDPYLKGIMLAFTNPGGEVDLSVSHQRLDDKLRALTDGTLSLEASSYFSIEPKQASARGSLYELESLIARKYFSAPIKAILGEQKTHRTESNTNAFWRSISAWWPFSSPDIPMPEILSDAQALVLDSATKYPLSVASGPPGTGKSFTIACMALKEFSQGKSVLVVSQNQHAADVVRRKLIDDLGIEPGVTVLASERGVSREAKQQIKSMLTRTYQDHKKSQIHLKRKLSQLIKQRDTTEIGYQVLLRDLEKGDSPKGPAGKTGWLQGFWSFGKSQTGDSNQFLFEKFLAIEELEQQIREVVIRLLGLRYEVSADQLSRQKKSRQSLRAFADSLTARNEHYQEKYYAKVNFNDVLNAVPLWFSSLGNLHRVLPMQREMFDLVIFDEATQCNLSVCLPALQRARRAVIVGDQKQLKHVSFVSYELQESLAKRHQIDTVELSHDFRNTSVLDYALSVCQQSQQSVLLDEHFRSHPQIIEFSNREFYQRSLKIMTERPTNRQRSIEVLQVDGKRLNKGLNKQEADAVVKRLKALITEQRRLPESDVHTVGVLAFFSTQADHIEKRVFDEISLNNLRRHNIRVGTPFSFQGEERDHMLISCSVDADTHGGSYAYLNRDDVFNVAITRARDFQSLFVSCNAQELRAGSKLADYLKYINEYQVQSELKQDVAHDAFQAEIGSWLQKRGVDVYKNYHVAGISIDLMAVFHGQALAIDLIGFDGALNNALSLTQLKLLQRAGLNSFLLPYPEWRQEPEKLLHALMLRLGAAHQTDQTAPQISKFSDEQEALFSAVTQGLSINQLNARFMRTDEVAAAKQLQSLVARHQRFIELLKTSFLPQELTYKRYNNVLDETCDYCLRNLQQASVAAELANSLLEQQKQLFGGAQFEPNNMNKVDDHSSQGFDDVIAARLSMIDEQRARLKSLMAKNERALLQIDQAMIKLIDLADDDERADPVSALQELTQKLDLYRGKTR